MNSLPIIPPVCAMWPASRSCKTVLVVDGFAPICDMVARHLSSLGYRVLTANDPVEAVKIFCSEGGRVIDLLLTDVKSPDMAGYRLAAWCAKVRPQIRLLFMSPNPRCLPVGNKTACLEKPFSLAELGAAVRDSLLDPAIAESPLPSVTLLDASPVDHQPASDEAALVA